MPETYIIDTNVFLFDPEALEHFPNANILVPMEVIEELDKFKHDNSETGRNARQTAHVIDALRKQGPLRNGVTLSNDARFWIVTDDSTIRRSSTRPANLAILQCAEAFRAQNPDRPPPVIITKNVNLRVKADAMGIPARDYEMAPVRDTDTLRGWRHLELPAPQIAALKQGLPLELPELRFHPHEYVFATEPDNRKSACCARRLTDGKLWPLLDTTRTVCGLRALNLEQTFTLDALLDQDVPLVTLAGRAGTGKTLLAIAAGLHQIFADNRYQRLLVFRPTMPVSRDMGFLPGDVNEKMRPWMQPVYDAIDFIRGQDRRLPVRTLPNDIMTCPEVSVEPLTYIRGRSIPGQFIIIDEAQNLTPLEVKTAITRVGAGSKIVLTGDPAQIDNPYVDAKSNGLTRLVDKFLHSPLAAHITLIKGKRSELAETASTLL